MLCAVMWCAVSCGMTVDCDAQINLLLLILWKWEVVFWDCVKFVCVRRWYGIYISCGVYETLVTFFTTYLIKYKG